MEVYTGFEKVSWSKKQRPKNTFSKKERIVAHKKLSTYESVFKNVPSKKASHIYTFLSVLLIGFVVFGLIFKISEFTDRNNRWTIEKQQRIERNNKFAYNFLINSGERRLINNNLVGAHSEFKLAQAIYPHDERVNQLLIETLIILCEDDAKYCEELNDILIKTL